MHPKRLAFMSICGLVCVLGCSSSRSTFLMRDDFNTEWTKKRACGMPITLKVPTHIKLYVYEKHFLEDVNVAGVHQVRYLEMPIVLRDFAQEFITTEKVVMVDFKRPAAGPFNLDVDFTTDQYLEQVQHDVTDETIRRVTELVNVLAPSGLFAAAGAGDPGGLIDPRLKEVKAVVAVGIFEIDSPTFEEEMQAFVNCHINQAHDAWMMPPGVRRFRRHPLSPEQAFPGPVLCPEGGPCLNHGGSVGAIGPVAPGVPAAPPERLPQTVPYHAPPSPVSSMRELETDPR